MDKKQVRRCLLEKRKEMPKAAKEIFDKEISEKIIQSDYFKTANQVLVFSSTEDEFNTRHIIEKCRQVQKRVFYPLCLDSNGEMEFREVTSNDDLIVGMYNILEPKEACKKYAFQENDIIIVPCLSVDKNGYRIGYGKGYYDRFLKNFCGVSICPCYKELLSDKLPTDENDIKINVLVTQHLTKEVIL